MCIRNRLVSLIYKLIIVGVSGAGIYLYSGLPEGSFNPVAFRYFTILSNLLVCVFFLANAIFLATRIPKKGVKGVSVYMPHLYGAVIMAITVTLLIYQFLLAPQNFVMPGTADAVRNSIVHLIVPLLALGDWLLFARKGRYTAGDPLLWEVIPLLYYAYTVIAAQLGTTYQSGSHYPYFFIDADALGWPAVLRNVGLLCLAFLVLGYILFGIDRLLGRFAKAPGTPGEKDRHGPTGKGRAAKRVYHAGDAAAMAPADSASENPPDTE